MKLYEQIDFSFQRKTEELKTGAPLALSGATPALAAALAARLAASGRRVLLMAEHDLKLARAEKARAEAMA